MFIVAIPKAYNFLAISYMLRVHSPPAARSLTSGDAKWASREWQDGGMSSDHPTVPAPRLPRLDPEVAVNRCREFAEAMARRRTVRDYSTDPIPLAAVREAVRAAATAPSGANLQP